MFNKKALSPVIGSILLIALTIVAISLIAGFIVPFVKNSLDTTKCQKFTDYFLFDETLGYNCYSSTNFKHAITIKLNKKNTDSREIIGFDLSLIKKGSAKKISVRKDDAESCDDGGISVFGSSCSGTIEIPGFNGYSTVTYLYHSPATEGKYERAEIYPVLKDMVCPNFDSIDLKLCNPPNLLG